MKTTMKANHRLLPRLALGGRWFVAGPAAAEPERSLKKKALIVLLVGCVISVLATYKVERIEEVCARTGASQRYTRYFSLVSTKPIVKESWVDEVLASRGAPAINHEWVRTMGDTTTIATFYHAHSRAPITYWIRNDTLEDLKESFSEAEIGKLADDFASGIRERQEAALERYRSRQ